MKAPCLRLTPALLIAAATAAARGQDVVSGLYLFVVDSDLGTQRGKFVVIR